MSSNIRAVANSKEYNYYFCDDRIVVLATAFTPINLIYYRGGFIGEAVGAAVAHSKEKEKERVLAEQQGWTLDQRLAADPKNNFDLAYEKVLGVKLSGGLSGPHLSMRIIADGGAEATISIGVSREELAQLAQVLPTIPGLQGKVRA